MTHKPIIPYVCDIKTGTVRVPTDVERKLSRFLRRPVRIRTSKDLAQAFTDVLRMSIAKKLHDMANKPSP